MFIFSKTSESASESTSESQACWRIAVHAGLYLQSVKQLMQGHCYINRTWETCTQIFFFAW